MNDMAIILFLTLVLINLKSIFLTIKINIITQSKGTFSMASLDENFNKLSVDIKVSNKIVNYSFVYGGYRFYYLEFDIEPGEIEIIIHTNITSLSHMFHGDLMIKSIKIQTIDHYITDISSLFYDAGYITYIDFSEFDTSRVTSFSETFLHCESLSSIKFGNYITSSVNNMYRMFCSCYNLLSLNLSCFDTSKVTDMESLFEDCNKLTSLDIKGFGVSRVKYFTSMFEGCASLNYLDLSNFLTLDLYNTSLMFFGCKSLISLDLNSFNTSKVTTMANMFGECILLKYLKIDNFDTSSVSDMEKMFYNCNNLKSLNISNFNGNNVRNTNEMFSGCDSLTSLDFKNFKPNKIENMCKMFFRCSNLKSLDLSNFDTSLTYDMESMFFGCKSLSYLNINNFNTTNVIYMANMFNQCSSLISLNLSSFKIMENTHYENILLETSENLIYCVNDSFYDKIKIDMNLKKCAIRVNCFPNWNNKPKKLIYDDSGPCVDYCNETEKYKYEYENKCYPSCPKRTTSLYNNNFLCEIFNENKFKQLLNKINNNILDQVGKANGIAKKSEIIEIVETTKNTKTFITDFIKSKEVIKTNNIDNDNNDNKKEYDLSKICRANDFFENKCIENKYKSMIEIIREDIISSLLNDKIDDIIKNQIDFYKIEDNIKYQITSSFNQNNTIYDDISIIYLNECEKRLKVVNNIPQNETLIIFKYDYKTDEAFVPIVGYDVFNPITKELLDLNECKTLKIDIILPTNISNDELYKHNPNSNYYKDKCNSFYNEKNVDMTLYDRKKEYNDKNLALCPNNCNYINYNNETKKVLCECEPLFNSSLITLDKIFNREKLLHNFKNIKKYINIGVIKCYKIIMNFKRLKNNIGSYIILFIVLIYVIGLILFLIKGYKLLNEKIDNIKIDNKIQNKTKNSKINNYPIKRNIGINKQIKNKQNKKIIKNKNLNTNNTSINKFKLQKNNKSLNLEKKDKNKIKYSDTELIIFDYSIAQKNDKMGYVKCYFSLIKTRHPLLSSFISNHDYNSMSIKICLLFFNFALNFTINALFFTDETMHKIIEDEGIFNFVYNLPITIYSTIISFVINFIIKKLALSQKSILEIRKKKNSKDMEKFAKKTKINLKIKFIFFFIISFILLSAFWFYITCFCAIYIKTQIYLIKDTLISFSLYLVTPFLIYLFVCIIRTKSLNKPGQCLYNISQYLQ